MHEARVLLFVSLLVPAVFGQTAAPVFTEDFEAGRLNPGIWVSQTSGEGTLEVQQERAAHGKYALRVRNPSPSQKTYALIRAASVPAALRNHLFGRAYVYITPGLPARHTVLLTAGTAGFPKDKYEEVATLNGRFQLTYADQANGGEDWHSGGADIPLNRWSCLEWEFNDRPDHATIWVDGEKIYETDFTFKSAGSNLVGGFTDIGFGFRLWGAGQPFDIYYDDIALSTVRIGPIRE